MNKYEQMKKAEADFEALYANKVTDDAELKQASDLCEQLNEEWHDAVHDAKSEQDFEQLGGLVKIEAEVAVERYGRICFAIIDGQSVMIEEVEPNGEGGYFIHIHTHVEWKGHTLTAEGTIDMPDGLTLYTFVDDDEDEGYVLN